MAAAKAKPNEIRITRIYDAPVKTVWDAWTDPEQVAKWWGPRGFTLTTHAKELKPGGIWHYTMHGPDGTDYPNKTYYHEVEEGSKLVYDHGAYDDRPPLFRVTALFSELASGNRKKTQLIMTMSLATPEEAEKTRKFIKQAGGNATWDRLAEYLSKKSDGKDLFVINRSFNAPIDRVFEMWANAEHWSRWLPPTGFKMEILRSDIRPGGNTFFKMSDGNVTFYGSMEHLTVDKPHRIVYTQRFCDADENPARHPGAPTWPETLLNVVQFTTEDDGQTRVTITSEAHGKATTEELAAFIQERAGMTQGWTGSLDQLEALLSS